MNRLILILCLLISGCGSGVEINCKLPDGSRFYAHSFGENKEDATYKAIARCKKAKEFMSYE